MPDLVVEKAQKALIYFNTGSGARSNSGIKKTLQALCNSHGVQAQFEEVKDGLKRNQIIKDAQNFCADVIVACGGDGTVNLIGSSLINTPYNLGIIPLGSSNALAKNLLIPIDTDQAFQVAISGKVKAIDTLLVNGKNCLHICDIGFNGNLVEQFHGAKLRGMMTYAWFALGQIRKLHFFKYTLDAGKQKVSGKAFSITLTNTKLYGTKAAINPEGKLDDGKFEICVIKPFPRFAIFNIMVRLYKRNLPKSIYSLYIRTDKVSVLNPESQGIHIDGEPLDKTTHLNVEVVPRSLRIAVPKGFN